MFRSGARERLFARFRTRCHVDRLDALPLSRLKPVQVTGHLEARRRVILVYLGTIGKMKPVVVLQGRS